MLQSDTRAVDDGEGTCGPRCDDEAGMRVGVGAWGQASRREKCDRRRARAGDLSFERGDHRLAQGRIIVDLRVRSTCRQQRDVGPHRPAGCWSEGDILTGERLRDVRRSVTRSRDDGTREVTVASQRDARRRSPCRWGSRWCSCARFTAPKVNLSREIVQSTDGEGVAVMITSSLYPRNGSNWSRL